MMKTGWMLGLTLAVGGAATAAAVTLPECVETALRVNPDVQAGRSRIAAAQAAARQARSAFYPQVTASGLYSRTDNPPQAFFMRLNQRTASLQEDFNQPDDTDNIRGSLGAKWLLLDGGQRGLGVDMARLGGAAAEAGLQAVRNELHYQVTQAYYAALQARAYVKVQDESTRSLEESLRVAAERLKAGSAIKTDVLNLEVRLAQAREDRITAANGFELAVAALNTAIGQDLATPETLADAATGDLPPPPATAEPAAVEQRAELHAVRLQAELLGQAWRKARRDYAPRLSAFGSEDWDSDSFSDFEQSYLVGAMVEWDVFTGFRREGGVAQARAEWEAARAAEQKVRNQLRLDLKQAHLKAQELWQRMDVARRSVASAEEALRITGERYSQGAADITDLLTAQVGLTMTRTRNVAVYHDYQTALANLARARGELQQ